MSDAPSSPSDRVALTAKISPESAEGWQNFCADNGISLTAFIEVAGLALARETFPPSVEARAQMVDDARKVDLARRSRRR